MERRLDSVDDPDDFEEPDEPLQLDEFDPEREELDELPDDEDDDDDPELYEPPMPGREWAGSSGMSAVIKTQAKSVRAIAASLEYLFPLRLYGVSTSDHVNHNFPEFGVDDPAIGPIVPDANTRHLGGAPATELNLEGCRGVTRINPRN